MEPVQRNPLLTHGNVEIECVACWPAAQPENSEAQSWGEHEDPLDIDGIEVDWEEFETGLDLCRWPNGEFSLVNADNRDDAVVHLDEWARAEPVWLVPLETCMIDFRLDDRGEIELGEYGEETHDFIWEKCYPELEQVRASSDALSYRSGKRSREAATKIRRAVEHERKRLWHEQKEGTSAKTAIAQELQKRLRTVGPVADCYVDFVANQSCERKWDRKENITKDGSRWGGAGIRIPRFRGLFVRRGP